MCANPVDVLAVAGSSRQDAVQAAPSIQTTRHVSMFTTFSGENWAYDFQMPFDKFPPIVMKHCKEGSRPNPEERSHVVRIIAYEISLLVKKPGKKNLEIIASKLVKQYPKTFGDEIANNPFGNGYASFLNSLIQRFDNMNRTKRTSLVAMLSETQKKAKKRCINYQPDNLPNEETENTQKEKKLWLQNHFPLKDQNEKKVNETMSTTFASQRLTINTVKLVEEAILEWPYLTFKKYLLQHFNTAMQPYEPDWDCIIQRKIPELLGYLRSKISSDTSSECDSIAILELLCLYFKEVNAIVQIYKVIFYAINFILQYFLILSCIF